MRVKGNKRGKVCPSLFTKWAKKGTNAGKREQTRDKRKSALQRLKSEFDTIAMTAKAIRTTLYALNATRASKR
ncbi:hypothetical protein CG392_06040 [Gardnerella vaginalis]|nr:hypothetical protein CG392_06040 [Gardnerella vaginalis]